MVDENYKNFLIIRPLKKGMITDINDMPMIKKSIIDKSDYKSIKITNFKNLSYITDRKDTIVDMFNYDYVLNSVWNDPLKYVALFQGLFAVSTPDFSIYSDMNIYQISYNVYKSRWIGSFWQSFGINVIPTISWYDEKTYDICFSGVEKESTVIISTLGVRNNKKIFLNGFNEMKKRLKPSLIIVVGRILDEMYGEFLVYELSDTFNPKKKYEQLSLFENIHYLRKEIGETKYGW